MKLPHWVLVGLSLLSCVIAWLVAHAQAGDIVLPATVLAVVPMVQAVIGMLSNPVTGKPRVPRMPLLVLGCALTFTFVTVGSALCACGLFSPAAVVLPAVDFATCVAQDAVQGMSVAAIASPNPPGCGGDALSVIAALLASPDAKVQGSPAFGEARRTELALKTLP